MLIQAAVLEQRENQRPYAEHRPLALRAVQLDGPGPGEVLVRINAAGLCHSDLSVIDGNRPRPVPMVLGHESAGIIEQAGEGVDLAVGQQVISVFLPRCGHCSACATGGKLPCIAGTEANTAGTLLTGARRLSMDGSPVHHHLGVSAFADHAVMDARSLVPVGRDVPPEVAAVLGCAVLTGGGALRNAAHAGGVEDVAIVGLGGVGMAALLVAVGQRTTGKILAIDANEDKLATALELGADEACTPQDLAGRGAQIVIEAAGHPRAFETALSATGVGGTLVTVGLPAPGAMSSIEPLALTAGARTIIGSYMGSALPAKDIPYYEELWRSGRLPVEKLVRTRPMAQINEALDELAEGRSVRQVLLP
ncbi:alcohol dehydrogenase catalytic domain-containing protein [Glutamicibacter sp. JL.03c]|uniref:alcohol dehydrogenase catalytic domain-containing protein n=1 Tax=Glutamicibacter sp. JL.03c TaxID=2984842 RepID=UPI0021F72644|nr:alcohol dehydrogenase catalytic domain-containing protein [Glutamicibacter sp. JL.03c]UYQ76914.1 alcohol dehydrogenase catalytic domain-containing protein [Glutamicibacter sp. JL.03c]